MSDRMPSRGQALPLKGETMCRQDTFNFRLFQGACAPSLTCISKSVGLPTDLLSTPGTKSVCFLPALPVNLFLDYIDLMMYVFLSHAQSVWVGDPHTANWTSCYVCSKQMQEKSSPVLFLTGVERRFSICGSVPITLFVTHRELVTKPKTQKVKQPIKPETINVSVQCPHHKVSNNNYSVWLDGLENKARKTQNRSFPLQCLVEMHTFCSWTQLFQMHSFSCPSENKISQE